MPSWSDKLVGEVVRLLLEAYYEPVFSDRSHGFRPGRGCHTALREVANTWTGTTWFVEGDIADCFGSFDHEVMIGILSEKIHDNRFLRLLRNMLTAGYLEDWRWNATLSGVPQGGLCAAAHKPPYQQCRVMRSRPARPGDSGAGGRALRITLPGAVAHRLASQLSSPGSWFHSGRSSLTMSVQAASRALRLASVEARA